MNGIQNNNTTKSKSIKISGKDFDFSRFIIQGKLSEGSFGVVYSGVDKDTGEEIVMKICKEEDMNRIESNVMKLLNRKAIKNFPKLLYSGIMPKGPGLIL